VGEKRKNTDRAKVAKKLPKRNSAAGKGKQKSWC